MKPIRVPTSAKRMMRSVIRSLAAFIATTSVFAFNPLAQTSGGESKKPDQEAAPFRPELGTFAPLEKAHAFRGELVFGEEAFASPAAARCSFNIVRNRSLFCPTALFDSKTRRRTCGTSPSEPSFTPADFYHRTPPTRRCPSFRNPRLNNRLKTIFCCSKTNQAIASVLARHGALRKSTFKSTSPNSSPPSSLEKHATRAPPSKL
jgi:hypothetical protein